MRKLLLVSLLFLTSMANAQYCAWFSQEVPGNSWEISFFCVDEFGQETAGTTRPILLNDSTKVTFIADTFDISLATTLYLSGQSSEYVRGDGSFGTFPSTGTDTITGANGILSYVVAHNLGYIPAYIDLSERSGDATSPHYISQKTDTSFTITFISQPAIGVDNILFDWVAIK